MKRIFRSYLLGLFFTYGALVLAGAAPARAQTDLRITGPQSGFPVAVPQLCDAGGAETSAKGVADVISKNLQLSGLFQVLNPSTFVETPGKCSPAENIAYSDWTVIGAEGVVRGEVKSTGDGNVEVTMYLHDVLQQRAVVGKRYQGEANDFRRIAHRFSNEIVKYFTGEPGVFGTRIAYVSRVGRFKELFIMDTDGSNIRQLTRDKGLAVSPGWSPAGDRIVYTSYRTRKPELFMISPEGGVPRQITRREGLELGAKFAPDGTKLLASATLAGSSNLVYFDLRGALLSNLTRGRAIDVSPSYSPDGSNVAFCSNRSGSPQIYVMPSTGGQARRISFTKSNYCTSPAWSPKGDRISFVCRQSGNQLFVAAPDGSQSVQLTFSGNNEDPSWSPDGRYLVYSSSKGRGEPKNIVMRLLAGGTPMQVSFAKSEDSQPAWSPLVE